MTRMEEIKQRQKLLAMAREMRNWLVDKYGSLGFIDVCGDKTGENIRNSL